MCQGLSGVLVTEGYPLVWTSIFLIIINKPGDGDLISIKNIKLKKSSN